VVEFGISIRTAMISRSAFSLVKAVSTKILLRKAIDKLNEE